MLDKIYDNLDECIKDAFKFASFFADEGVKKYIGGPFGAAIIQKQENKYKILVVERNQVILTNDPTAHAEINAIRKACKLLSTKHISDCILVTTAKSCPMCLSAACWAHIKTIYYSVDYSTTTTSGFQDNDIYQYIIGENDNLIQEIKCNHECCEIPFKTWNELEDKTTY